jgi:hypothetical protein
MGYLQDINVTINLRTKPLSQAGFSLPLILGAKVATHAAVGVYRLVSQLTDLISAGYTTADEEYKMAAAMLGQSPSPSQIAVFSRPDTDSITTALGNLAQTHNDWYALLIQERLSASLHEAGDAASGMKKLFIGCSADTAALTGRNNIREAYLIHDQASAFPEAAWAGHCLPKTLGTYTWKWKSPSGVTAANLTSTQLQAIRDAHGQSVESFAGVTFVDEGITTGGEFIDVIQRMDYIQARVHEDLFGLNIRMDQVAYDDKGFALVDATIRTRLKASAAAGMIAAVGSKEDMEYSDDGVHMFKVSVPRRADIPVNDRAARILSGVTFSFVVSGAVHKYNVNGDLLV